MKISNAEELSIAFLKFLIENDLNIYEMKGKIILAHSSDDFFINLNGILGVCPMVKTVEDIREALLKWLVENSLNMYESNGMIILAHSSDDFFINLNEWIDE